MFSLQIEVILKAALLYWLASFYFAFSSCFQDSAREGNTMNLNFQPLFKKKIANCLAAS